MQIKFSRHAKRRIKLYKIPESTITKILERKELSEGYQEIIETVKGFKYPLKIIVTLKHEIVTVITSYPLKKEREK